MTPLVLIGASEGGIRALRSVAAALPADFPASLVIVLHIGAHKSELPALLNSTGPLRASHAQDGELIEPSRIYVAPPDHHVLVEPVRLRLTRGPRENCARPAIDPLFRSAAPIYGMQTIGVILTGGLNDGTAGLIEIKRYGGIAVVQDPDDAVNPSMPRSALTHVAVDYRPTIAELPGLLASLVAGLATGPASSPAAESTSGWEKIVGDFTLDQPVAITCPDCGGALRRLEMGSLIQYGCHIGHVYTQEIMLMAQFTAMESSLEAAMRAISERGELCRQMAGKLRLAGDFDVAAKWTAAMQEARERAISVRSLLETEWLRPQGDEGLSVFNGQKPTVDTWMPEPKAPLPPTPIPAP